MPIHDRGRTGSVDAEARPSKLEVRILDWIDVVSIPTLRVGEGIGFRFKSANHRESRQEAGRPGTNHA